MSRMPRTLVVVLTELKQLLEKRQNASLDFSQEIDLAERALASGVEAQVFRSIETLVLSTHAAGLTAIEQAPVFLEAVQVLLMSGKQLPSGLAADNP